MKREFLFILFLLFAKFIYSQPEPCIDIQPEMTPFCEDACIICDIDGFTGRHDSNVTGALPAGFCTNVVHNGQWIGFIAGSEDLVIDMEVSNCQLGVGLEIAIYEGIDCQNFRLISNCFGARTAISPGSTGRVTVTEPLIIGQYYYLVMDGALADNCDWTLTVVQGDTQVAPLGTSGDIDGDFTTCPGVSTTYVTSGEAGATIFDWTLNGVPVGDNNQEITIDWTQNGTFQLCVTAKNACDEAPPTCRDIEVTSILPQTFNFTICEGESIQVSDTIILFDEGNYEFNFLSEEGCDSTIFVNLTVNKPNASNLDFNICDGDTVFVGGVPFFEPGLYTEILQNRFGCDSLVNLTLGVIICEIEGNSVETPVVCFGDSTGQIEFFIENGTPPFSYTWEILDESISGNGNISNLNQPILIENLPKGTYLITVQDDFGNDVILIQDVNEPSILNADSDILDLAGFNVSCFGGADGAIMALPSGGVPPYVYLWSNGATEQTIENISAGNYAVNISDSYGCEIALDFELFQPPPLRLNAVFQNPGCEGFQTGAIQIQSASGGVPPYQYAFDGGTFSDDLSFENLEEGRYTVSVRDANGCETDTTHSLLASVIPVVNLGEDLTLFLGDSVQLQIQSNVILDSVLWSDEPNLSCLACPNPTVQAVGNTQYRVAVTSQDGCTALDSIFINVENRRRVFVPSAFSPNNDGINDVLQIFAGPEVQKVNTFSVFSRWGDQLFSMKNFQANDPSFGWDGSFRGKVLKLGVYAWFAEIEYLDGSIDIFKGDVSILK